MARRRTGLRKSLLLFLAQIACSRASLAGEWTQVARDGQEVPGTGAAIQSFLVSDFGRELRVGTDGRVWTTGAYRGGSDYFGLLRWSPESGLEELLPIGAPLDDVSGLTAEIQWLLDTGSDGRVAVGAWTGQACDGPPSAVLVDGMDRITTIARCDSLAALIPANAVSDGIFSMGITDVGEIALDLVYDENHDALLVPDGDGGFVIPARTRDPAPGDSLRELAYVGPGFWRAGRLAFMSYLAQDRDAQVPAPGDGDAIYLWDPTEGFSLVARADSLEPTSAPWSNLSDLQVGGDGYLVWFADAAWDGTDEWTPREVLLGSNGQGPPEVLMAEDDPIPDAGPDATVFAFFPGEMLVMEPGGAALHVEVETGDDYYTALFTRVPGGKMALRLRSGQPIPRSDGLVYHQFMPVAASGDGRLAFRTSTTRDPWTYALLEPDGSSYLLRQLLPGDRIQYAPGDVRTVDYVGATSFDRELGFMAQLVDFEAPGGSAIYLTTVPEPIAAARGVAAGLALAGLARRRCQARSAS